MMITFQFLNFHIIYPCHHFFSPITSSNQFTGSINHLFGQHHHLPKSSFWLPNYIRLDNHKWLIWVNFG